MVELFNSSFIMENGEKIHYLVDLETHFQYVIEPIEMMKVRKQVLATEEIKRRQKGKKYHSISEEKLIVGYLTEKLVESSLKFKFKKISTLEIHNIANEEKPIDIIVCYRHKVVGKLQVKGKVVNNQKEDKDLDYEKIKRGETPISKVTHTLGDEIKYNRLKAEGNHNFALSFASNTLSANSKQATTINMPGYFKDEDLDILSSGKGLLYCKHPDFNNYADFIVSIERNIDTINNSSQGIFQDCPYNKTE